MTRQQQAGFTLIELMIVIAILGILIAIALPSYQDYAIRTKNTECLNVAAAAKLAVAETHHGAVLLASIASNADVGYAFVQSDFCQDVSVGANGVITATTRNTGAPVMAVFTLTPTADVDTGHMAWDCSETAGVAAAQIPKVCR